MKILYKYEKYKTSSPIYLEPDISHTLGHYSKENTIKSNETARVSYLAPNERRHPTSLTVKFQTYFFCITKLFHKQHTAHKLTAFVEIGISRNFLHLNHNRFIIAVSVPRPGRACTTSRRPSTGSSSPASPTVLPPTAGHPPAHFDRFRDFVFAAAAASTNRNRGRLLDEDFLRGRRRRTATGNGRRRRFVATGDATHYDRLLALEFRRAGPGGHSRREGDHRMAEIQIGPLGGGAIVANAAGAASVLRFDHRWRR